MRPDWILFILLALLWLGAGGVRLRMPARGDGGILGPDGTGESGDGPLR
jgi:hypothetical protein